MKAGDGILVKDYDGTFKILSNGELGELGPLLEESQGLPSSALPQIAPEHHLVVPESSPHFQENSSKGVSSAIRELHFHPDDHDDVQRELQKIQQFFAFGQQKKYSIEKIARKLVDKQKLSLTDGEFQVFTRALLSFFRQMRSTAEVRARLAQPAASGGLGIADAAVDHILSIAKYLKDKIEEADGTVVEESGEGSAAAPAASQAATQPPPVAQPVTMEAPMPAPQPIPQKPEMAPIQLSRPGSAPNVPSRPVPTPVVQDLPAIPRVQRPTAGFAPIPVIEDVKRSVRSGGLLRGRQQSPLTGRVEELAEMTLDLWRLLDPNPRIRAGKILGKIQNLERESFTRKSQGIDAWRQSAVYQLYLQLGSMSLEQGKNVAQVIAFLTTSGTTTLTIEEFEAISDLNRMLRF